MSEEVEYVKVGDLKPYLGKVYLKAKIVEMREPREVARGEHRVSDVLVGDESGCIYLTLWDNSIDEFEVGNTVHVENGYVSVFNESMRLTAGKYGTITKIDEEISEVNTESNLSDRRVEQITRRPYVSYDDRSDRGYRSRRYGRGRREKRDWQTGYRKRR